MDEQKKYIDADAIHDILASHFCACSDETEETLHSVWNELKAIPAADVQSANRGRWVTRAFSNLKTCPLCEKYATKVSFEGQPDFDYIFCPYCGAMLDDAD